MTYDSYAPARIGTPPLILAEAVRTELRGESVLWAARPDRSAYLRREGSNFGYAAFNIVFVAIWLRLAGQAGKSGNGASWLFVLFGAFFVLNVLKGVLTPIWEVWGEGRIFYVLTERRAIIFRKHWHLKIESFEASALQNLERVSHGGYSGSIILRRIHTRGPKGSVRVQDVGFLGLAFYAEAECALRELIKRQNAAPVPKENTP